MEWSAAEGWGLGTAVWWVAKKAARAVRWVAATDASLAGLTAVTRERTVGKKAAEMVFSPAVSLVEKLVDGMVCQKGI